MYYSKLFGKTVRDVKSDMVAMSHKLLYKAGFTRELSTGRYELLPLGFRTCKKIIDLIDAEMEAIGSQRMSIPILQPIEYWKKSNRDSVWGKSLMKVVDRNKSEFILSATGEGVVTEMVADTKPSYKDLPIIVHQFIIKIRDEERPRCGVLRTREFDMKDAYSYNATEKDFMKTYQDFYTAYSNLCKKLNIPYYACIADSGALGGDYCHEFQVPCEAGEDHIVKCNRCDYAANVEKSEFEREKINEKEEKKEFKFVKLPTEVATIKELVKHYKMPKSRFIKNVVYKTSKGKLVIATVTGNLDVHEAKLAKAVNEGDLEKATDKDLASIGSKSGFVHSWGYEKFRKKIIFVVDLGIPLAKNLYGGFKTETEDPINVNYGRDFSADIIADVASPYTGAPCKKCGGKLELIRSIEFGHIFKYDHFYTQHHHGYYTDKFGKEKLMYMGAYGIGIQRAMAIVVEKHHDEKGIIWPISIAPYKVHLITLGEEKNITDKAQDIYDALLKNDIDVLWDDRSDFSAGVKFNDADLIGIPLRLVVSSRSLSKDGVEFKVRAEKDATIVELDKIISVIKQKIEEFTKELSA
jgi:prolyl-tRNA synthetase